MKGWNLTIYNENNSTKLTDNNVVKELQLSRSAKKSTGCLKDVLPRQARHLADVQKKS